MVADEDCSMKATARPARKPRRGLSPKLVNSLEKDSDSDKGATALVMLRSPVNNMPNPMAIVPMVEEFFLFTNIMNTMPMTVQVKAKRYGRCMK